MSNIIMADKPSGKKITTRITTTGALNTELNAAHIKPIAQNEILIWNVKGANTQGSGSVGAKFGIVVLQNGAVVDNSGGTKLMASKTYPDNAIPGNWAAGTTYGTIHSLNDSGEYSAGSEASYYVGIGNTIEFVQIPYDIGWNT